MNSFESRYDNLNDAQRKAVDTVDGPVMVVAGPGTGKTELLSMRVANILRTTDALPGNILCLTYTESGAYAMRERLAGLIGADAYKVAIHTFHSFGSEIINQNAEYFYHGAYFRPADQLSSYEILRALFEKLPHSSPLASTMNNDFTYLRDTQTALSDLKKSGLTSDELLEILGRNDRFLEWFQPRLHAAIGDRLSKKSFAAVDDLLDECAAYEEEPYDLITYESLSRVVQTSLQLARDDAESDDSTKPLSAWKRTWCEKRADGELTLKDAKRTRILRSVAGIYYDYLLAMQERSLYDFDDMILRTVHALEVFADLRLNLQERYQYVLVDEFQDTNDAQMRLIWNLTNNPVSNGRPNVMVVGDDDQAIYRFQGATLSNVLEYRNRYRDVALIVLTENYRSSQPIIAAASQTIQHAVERLERTVDGLDKTLIPHHEPEQTSVDFTSYADDASQYAAIASDIHKRRASHPSETIAIIARHHKQLRALVPYLHDRGVALSYDRRDNVLESEPMLFLERLARTVHALSHQQLDDVNELLPEVLSHPAWGLTTEELWQLSLTSYKNGSLWLETMLAHEGKLADIAQWLVYSAHLSLHEPLEHVIDHLTGTTENQAADDTIAETGDQTAETSHDPERFRSPLRDHFFSHDLLTDNPSRYVAYLDALNSVRRHVRDYRPEGQLMLHDFMHLIDRYRELDIPVQSTGHIASEGNPVELLTAHRSKGLEFDAVYVVGLNDSVWGETARTRSRLINYPHNLPIGIGGDSSDEHIRLLFVALTRARDTLRLFASRSTADGKPLLPVGYLGHIQLDASEVMRSAVEEQRLVWHARLTEPENHTLHELLTPRMERYKLSATHLCNFLDVTRGGPELFLLQNLLRFPQAMGPASAFGSAIHATLQRAHAHLSATGNRRPTEDLLADFETSLSQYQLSTDQYEFFLKKGSDVLNAFLDARYGSFNRDQRVEQQFGTETVLLGEARLSGAIDLMDIDEHAKTIVVTDYKTGRSTNTWLGKTPYEKIKLHHYRQQLMFYKFLIENSRSYAGYRVTSGVIEFVERDSAGVINRLSLDYDKDELADFKLLVAGVWKRIQALDFKLTDDYPATLEGIKAFEDFLRSDI